MTFGLGWIFFGRRIGNILKNVFINEKRRYICSPKGAGTIAQLVEQRTENPCVAGSIPAGTTDLKNPLFAK